MVSAPGELLADGLSVDGAVRRLRDRLDRRHVLVLLSIFAVAVLFRVRNLGAAPLWIDEAHSSWAARNFLEGQGFSDPVGRSSPYRRAWLTTSLPIAVSFAVLGTSEFAARFPMVIYGLLTVGVAYLLGAHFHRLAGSMLAAFVAVDPFVVVWSRTARMYAPLTFLYLASLYVAIRWYSQRDFEFRSPYPVVLGVLALLGIETQRAYLAFGAVAGLFFAVVALSGLWRLDDWQLDAVDAKTRRAGLLFVGTALVAILFVSLRGLPDILTAQPPEAWPEYETTFYWTYLGDTYLFVRYLAIVGLVYLWIRYEAARLLVLAFVVPFLVATITPRKAPRFIVHLVPVLGALVFVPIADGLRFTWAKITEDDDDVGGYEVGLASVGPLVLLVILAAPFAGLAVADDTYNPQHQAERSDWAVASDFLEAEAAEDAIIVSTRPELSLWYFGETEYFFRQNSLGRVASADGEYVHPRTGTVFLNETADIEQLTTQDREVWLLADKKFTDEFTAPEARQFVQREFVRRGNESWVNMELYYHPGDTADNSTGS